MYNSAHFTDEATGHRPPALPEVAGLLPAYEKQELVLPALDRPALSSCSGGEGLLWFGLLPEGREPCPPLLYMTFKKYHLINRLWAVNTARSPAPPCLAVAWVLTYASEPCQAELALAAARRACQPLWRSPYAAVPIPVHSSAWLFCPVTDLDKLVRARLGPLSRAQGHLCKPPPPHPAGRLRAPWRKHPALHQKPSTLIS